jgi:hypothetical protein
MPVKGYNLATCYCVIGGVLVTGGFGDNGIQLDEQPLFEMVRGAAGEVVACRVVQKDVNGKLSLFQTSVAHRNLAVALDTQRIAVDAGGPLVPLPFLLIDAQSGTTIKGSVTFLARPAIKFGKNAEAIEYSINVGDFVPVTNPLVAV